MDVFNSKVLQAWKFLRSGTTKCKAKQPHTQGRSRGGGGGKRGNSPPEIFSEITSLQTMILMLNVNLLTTQAGAD